MRNKFPNDEQINQKINELENIIVNPLHYFPNNPNKLAEYGIVMDTLKYQSDNKYKTQINKQINDLKPNLKKELQKMQFAIKPDAPITNQRSNQSPETTPMSDFYSINAPSTISAGDNMCNITAMVRSLVGLKSDFSAEDVKIVLREKYGMKDSELQSFTKTEDFVELLLQKQSMKNILELSNGKTHDRENINNLKSLAEELGFKGSVRSIDFSKDYKTYQDIKQKMELGEQIELRTSLTSSGHYVHLERITDNGIYVNDPYGWHGSGNNYDQTNSDSLNTNYGAFQFYTWDEVKKYKIGSGYIGYSKK